MRCLQCNKKLSLLKMAKGDSFCSPEHFDAYQLELSRNAYKRLLSVPDEDVPKAPLISKKPAEEPVELHPAAPAKELEADAALARLSAFRAPEKIEAAPPFKAPPFAPFLASPPPSQAPNPAVIAAVKPASAREANEPVQAARNLAFPVHDVQATVCILNLYLRLGLAETQPRNWAREWKIIAAAEDFLGEIVRPALEVGPGVEPFENPAPGERDEPVAAPVEFAEREENPLVSAADEPVTAPLPEVQALPVVEAAALVETESILERADRLPFLVAPSFLEREWAGTPFDTTASATPREWMLAPELNTVQERVDVCRGATAQSTAFAEIPSLQPKDAAGERLAGGFAMPAVPVPLLPGGRAIEFYRWQASSGTIEMACRPLQTSRESTRAVDFALPSPAPGRPIAGLPPSHRGLIPEAASLLRSFLKTSPRGTGPALVKTPRGALECRFTAILAPFPARRGDSPALPHQAPHFSDRRALVDSAGSAEFAAEPLRYTPDCGRSIKPRAACERAPLVAMLPYHPAQWRRTDFALPAGADPSPTNWRPLCLLSPAGVWERPQLPANTAWRGFFESAFTGASNTLCVPPEAAAGLPTTVLPATPDITARDWRIGLCALRVAWSPCLPATSTRPLAFLPVRGGAVLPSARSWPRLGAPPQ